MTTTVDVLNEALVACEQPEMTGPTDTSSWVRRVRNRYPATVRKLLERHPWNFATERVQLQALATAVVGREYAYNKPGDCLRINRINDTGSAEDDSSFDYEDEAGKILADMDPCYLFYISSAWMKKEGAWPQVFADAASADLAAKCYGVFGKNVEKKALLRKEAKEALQVAKSWDASQKPFQPLRRGAWARARGGVRNPHGDGGPLS